MMKLIWFSFLYVLFVSTTVAAQEKTNALSADFYQAVNFIAENKFAEAAKRLDSVKTLATKQGIVNLPDFSLELLNQSDAMLAKGDRDQARFLVNHAVELSPRSPKILVLAVSYSDLFEPSKRLGFLWQALKALPSHPVTLLTLLLNVYLVSLCALTVAFFSVCVVQMIRSGEALFYSFAAWFPRSIRAYCAVISLLAVLVLPFWGGIACAIACWSLALTRARTACTWLTALAGALLCCWGLTIPVVGTVGYNAERTANEVVEEINNRSYSPKGEAFVRHGVTVESGDPLLHFALGQIYQIEGNAVAARAQYQKVLALVTVKHALFESSRLNIAALDFQEGNIPGARSVFEELEAQGIKTFELYYNLAQVHLASTNLDGNRRYLGLARDLDAPRLNELEARNEHGVLVSVIPRSFYVSLLLKPVFFSNDLAAKRVDQLGEQLAAVFLIGGSTKVLIVFGALLGVFGLLIRHKRGHLGYRKIDKGSPMWVFVPAGSLVAGEYPVLGVGMLGLFLAAIMLAFEAPAQLYGALPVGASFRPFWISIAVALYLLFLLFSILLRFKKEPRIEAAIS